MNNKILLLVICCMISMLVLTSCQPGAITTPPTSTNYLSQSKLVPANFSGTQVNSGGQMWYKYSSNNLPYWTSTGSSNFSFTQTLYLSNFGFSIPSNAVIKGVKLDMARLSVGNTAKDSAIYLVSSNGNTISNNMAKNDIFDASLGPTDYLDAYGDSTNTWGANLIPNTINNNNFGLNLAFTNTGSATSGVRVQYLNLTVFYTISNTSTNICTPNARTCVNNIGAKPSSNVCSTDGKSYISSDTCANGCNVTTGNCIGVAPCVPKTCSQIGKQCGNYDNGCNGVVSCGGCTGINVCNNYGVCVVPAECTSDSQCNDNNVCTSDTCVNTYCKNYQPDINCGIKCRVYQDVVNAGCSTNVGKIFTSQGFKEYFEDNKLFVIIMSILLVVVLIILGRYAFSTKKKR